MWIGALGVRGRGLVLGVRGRGLVWRGALGVRGRRLVWRGSSRCTRKRASVEG
jgi:hypothetical protein